MNTTEVDFSNDDTDYGTIKCLCSATVEFNYYQTAPSPCPACQREWTMSPDRKKATLDERTGPPF